MRIVVLLILGAIIFSLGSGLYYLTRDQMDSGRLLRALTWRIGLSVLLFGGLLLAGFMGWIEPGSG
ncbi:MAG: twin transmembrane helix small protein [Pseudomonadota bacterium]